MTMTEKHSCIYASLPSYWPVNLVVGIQEPKVKGETEGGRNIALCLKKVVSVIERQLCKDTFL